MSSLYTDQCLYTKKASNESVHHIKLLHFSPLDSFGLFLQSLYEHLVLNSNRSCSIKISLFIKDEQKSCVLEQHDVRKLYQK